MKKRIVFGIIVVWVGVVLGISCTKIVSMMQMYQQGKVTYDSLSEEVVSEKQQVQQRTQIEKEAQAQETDTETAALDIQVDFTTLQKENDDIAGWLYSPGTVISYPIVQGSDNAYYLNHTFEKKENQNGCIFLNADNAKDYSDTNSFLYGHHMKNGTMFASLINYREQDYYDQHPVMYLMTAEGDYEIQIFAAFTTSAYSDVYETSFATKQEFDAWYYDCMTKNNVTADVDVSWGDQIVTLSTCEYSYDDARYVVLGVLRPYQPDIEI